MGIAAVVVNNLPELFLGITWSAVTFWLGRRFERHGVKGLLFWRNYQTT